MYLPKAVGRLNRDAYLANSLPFPRVYQVNNVAPGTVYSPTAAANYPFDVFEYQRPFIPFKRLGTLEEVSGAVIYLLSPAASFVSGVTIEVDGGQSLAGGFWTVPEHEKSRPYRWTEEAEE